MRYQSTLTLWNYIKKNAALWSYLTPIGWVLAFVSFKNDEDHDAITAHHLRQSLGTHITFIIGRWLIGSLGILYYFLPIKDILMAALAILYITYLILGAVRANAGKSGIGVQEPLPYVGLHFDRFFSFIQ